MLNIGKLTSLTGVVDSQSSTNVIRRLVSEHGIADHFLVPVRIEEQWRATVMEGYQNGHDRVLVELIDFHHCGLRRTSRHGRTAELRAGAHGSGHSTFRKLC